MVDENVESISSKEVQLSQYNQPSLVARIGRIIDDNHRLTTDLYSRGLVHNLQIIILILIQLGQIFRITHRCLIFLLHMLLLLMATLQDRTHLIQTLMDHIMAQPRCQHNITHFRRLLVILNHTNTFHPLLLCNLILTAWPFKPHLPVILSKRTLLCHQISATFRLLTQRTRNHSNLTPPLLILSNTAIPVLSLVQSNQRLPFRTSISLIPLHPRSPSH